MSRLAVLGVVMACVFAIAHFSGGQVGASSACLNSNCFVTASSSAESVVTALALAIFVALYPCKPGALDDDRVVGVWRRLGAFFLDFLAVLSVFSPLLVLPLLVAEAGVTDEFRWAFERNYARPSDTAYMLSATFGSFILIFVYFYMHLRMNRPTLGQYVSGYRIVSSVNELPRPAIRVIASWLGLCAWPVSLILALKRNDKWFWWDTISGTHAVRVMQVSKSLQPTAERGG